MRVHRAVLFSTCRHLQAVLGDAGCCGEAQVGGAVTLESLGTFPNFGKSVKLAKLS